MPLPVACLCLLCLLQALCKRFFEHCAAAGVALPVRGFSLAYDTNIPRQAGLSGSSAIICAGWCAQRMCRSQSSTRCVAQPAWPLTPLASHHHMRPAPCTRRAGLNCLLRFFQLPDAALPVRQRPSLVLAAEAELGITAGLQDRVIQAYGGLVFMDFEQQHMAAHGCGLYESLDPALLPRLWLVWCDNPSDSGRMHSTVKQRWLAGDAQVVQGMRDVAHCAADGRCA